MKSAPFLDEVTKKKKRNRKKKGEERMLNVQDDGDDEDNRSPRQGGSLTGEIDRGRRCGRLERDKSRFRSSERDGLKFRIDDRGERGLDEVDTGASSDGGQSTNTRLHTLLGPRRRRQRWYPLPGPWLRI